MTTGTEQPIEVENRTRVITEHLASIDPVLAPLAPKLISVKDLSSPEPFVQGKQQLEPADLVLVHLTDTFPEGGIIHPRAFYERNFYEPGALRHTIHFTVNSVAGEIAGTNHNWNDRKYAIFIPFNKVIGRVKTFHPSDTFIIDDLVLPQGTVILASANDQLNSTGVREAHLLLADYSQPGERLSGFQRAVYEQMINQGYFPQIWWEYGWGSPDWAQSNHASEIFTNFCKRFNLPLPPSSYAVHEKHWTGIMEDLHFKADLAAHNKDETAFAGTINGAQQFLQDFQDIPIKQKRALVDLLRKYQRYFPGVEIEIKA